MEMRLLPRNRILLLASALCALIVLPSVAGAQRAGTAAAPPVPAPQFILRGLDQLRGDSAAAAIATWTSAWKGPTDASKSASLLASLEQIREMLGLPRGYEVVATEAVGQHLRRVYVLLRYDAQPVFAQFAAYSSVDRPNEGDWKLATVTWNTTVTEAWPSSVWSR